MDFQVIIDAANKKFGKPCLVHAVKNIATLKSILADKLIKVPKSKKGKSPMEPILGIDKTVFLSLGFQYNLAHHGWPYALIFDIGLAKSNKIAVYSDFIILGAYKLIVSYWKENDPKYLDVIKSKSPKIRRIIEEFLDTGRFAFWKIERELFNALMKYPQKRKLINLIRKYVNSEKVSSKKSYLKTHFKHARAEIVSYCPIFVEVPMLIGFYVQSKKKKEFFSMLNKTNLKTDINNLVIFNENFRPKPIKF